MDRKTEEKIRALLAYVCKSVPFYQSYFDGRIPRALDEVPVTTKKDIVENFDAFVSKDVDWNDCSVEYTTGSTGMPLRCVKSGKDTLISQRRLWQLRSRWLPGVLGKRLLAFSNSFLLRPVWPFQAGQEPDAPTPREKKKYYGKLDLRYFTPREIVEEPVDLLIERIHEAKADWVRATPSLISEFCRRVESTKDSIKNSSIKFIEVTGENFGPDERALIERTFGCRVANLYATREVWPIAYECFFGQLHIIESHVYCEVINQKKYQAQGAGELCLTALNQRVFPFIRYQIGDVVRIAEASCQCNIVGKVIQSIEGRVGQMIAIGNKSYSSQVFSELVKELTSRKIVDAGRFFVTQNEEYLFELTIERRGEVRADYAEYIQTRLQNYLPMGVKVITLLVESLPPKYSDKQKFFFTKI